MYYEALGIGIITCCASTGFRVEMLEKVIHLLNLLNSLNSHPFLKRKWVLKGGTALNMFVFNLPRLSVDIDLNYIGALNLEEMSKERRVPDENIAGYPV